MAVKLSSLSLDLERERAGEWREIPDWPGVRVKVRSSHNPEYVSAHGQMVTRLVRKYGRKQIPPEVLSEEMGRLCAQYILVDWDGLDEKYSLAVAIETLTNPAFRRVLDAIMAEAAQVGERDVEYVDEYVEEAEKN